MRYPDYIRQPAVVNTKQLPSESAGLYSQDSQPMPTVAPGTYYQPGLNSNDQYNQPNLNAQLDARSQTWQANAAQQAQQPPQTISSNDYIYYPTHPKANKAGFIRVIRDNYNPQIDSQNQQWDPQNPPARNQMYNTQETTGYNGQYQGYASQPAISGANQQFVESPTPSLQQNPQWQTRPALPNIQIAASQGTDRSYNPGQLAADRTPTVSNVTVTGIGEPAPAPSGLAPVAPDAQPVPLDNTNINTATGISQAENQYNKNVEFPSIANIERMKTSKTQIAQTGEAPIKEKMPTSITFGSDYPAQNPLIQPNIEPVGPTPQTVTQTTADFTGTVDKIGDSIIHLERYVASHPDDTKAQLTLRLLYSVYGNDDKALQYLPSTPTENQSQSLALAQALLLTTTTQTGLATDHNEAQAANQALKALESLTKKLSAQADPVISCVKICNENVTGFGKYEVLPGEELQTGLPRTIKVYCELENIKAKLNEEGKYYTDLYAEFTLYDSQLRPKAELKSDVPDTPIYNQRRDFCLWGPLTLPNLPPDKYKITVRVEDKLAGRIAETKSYEFEVK
jgi:hypothetical protein